MSGASFIPLPGGTSTYTAFLRSQFKRWRHTKAAPLYPLLVPPLNFPPKHNQKDRQNCTVKRFAAPMQSDPMLTSVLQTQITRSSIAIILCQRRFVQQASFQQLSCFSTPYSSPHPCDAASRLCIPCKRDVKTSASWASAIEEYSR